MLPSPGDPWIGRRVERCRIERPLGRGGHALAYLAYDEELLEQRVIKIALDVPEPRGVDDLRDFLDEGLLLSRLKHPQIVTLRSQGEWEGRRYMILDYIQGPNLREVLDAAARGLKSGAPWGETLPPATALALVLSAARPLAYAHAARVRLPGRDIRGVAHRDIAPGNLILGSRGDERGRVILIDFGTAKTDLDTLTTLRPGLVGTVPYMSRARLHKSDTGGANAAFWKGFRDTRHDVHALGALFFQLLTGRLPFPGEGTPQIITGILDPQRYPALSGEAEEVLPGAGEIVGKCLVWHDFARPWEEQPFQYPDAAAMIPELESLLRKTSPAQNEQSLLAALLARVETPDIPILSAPARPAPAATPPAALALRVRPKAQWPWYAAAGLTAVAVFSVLTFPLRKPDPKLPPAVGDSSLEVLAAVPEPTPAKAPPRKKRTPVKSPTSSPPPVPDVAPERPAEAPALDARTFQDLQSQVRQRPADALEALRQARRHFRVSPDLRFLECEAQVRLEEWSPALRSAMLELLLERPVWLDSRLYRENLRYWVWRADLHHYRERPENPETRRNLAASANAYLSEFGANPDLRAKITRSPASGPP